MDKKSKLNKRWKKASGDGEIAESNEHHVMKRS